MLEPWALMLIPIRLQFANQDIALLITKRTFSPISKWLTVFFFFWKDNSLSSLEGFPASENVRPLCRLQVKASTLETPYINVICFLTNLQRAQRHLRWLANKDERGPNRGSWSSTPSDQSELSPRPTHHEGLLMTNSLQRCAEFSSFPFHSHPNEISSLFMTVTDAVDGERG